MSNDCTYYHLLGVPMDASEKEITDAKNFLIKRLHPDANIGGGFDTTLYIQNILEAYQTLSSPERRLSYDRRLRPPLRRQDGRYVDGFGPSPNFAPYWEAANKLNELVGKGASFLKRGPFFKRKAPCAELIELAAQAKPHIALLRDGEIPQKYWFSHAINWLLFQWSQNRDLPYEMLYTMYDSYMEQFLPSSKKKKITGETSLFLSNLNKMTAGI